MILRNLFCCLLASAMIASGRVRRAKRRVLDSRIITAIYFHNPNRRLFARCVRWLTNNGYTFISDDELIDILQGDLEPPKGAVWLSFDDGFKELLENVVPLSRRQNIPITVFVPSAIVGGQGLFPWLHHTMNSQDAIRDAITVADLKEMAEDPKVSIGSHTVGHVVTPSLSDERARYEFGESKRALESWTGRAIKTFAYPEGRLNGRESHFLAECGYQMAATTEANFVTQATNPYFVPRFHVGDNIPFPEAICNMVGVWRPAIDPLIRVLRSWGKISERFWHTQAGQHRNHRETSI